MFIKTIEAEVDGKTWPRNSPPPVNLLRGAGLCNVDLASALLMLGTLTMPNLLSPASPARFWAWLRYFLAPADTNDLRITMDFADLDPHQKGILSDDFGVAISTQWLFDRFGGFTDIVDGRRFMLQFSHLLRNKKKSKAKVGPSKTPDFVLRDRSGKWHVLECKGTQSGRGWRNKFLKDALSQKQMLQIVGRIRGERLATGLAISNEESKQQTHLRVIDPEVEPIITLDDSDADQIERNVQRISLAQALGVVGLNEAAVEIALPPDIVSSDKLLRPMEIKRARSSRETRYGRAAQQLKERNLERLEHKHARYEGRKVRFEFPDLGRQRLFDEIDVQQGVNHDFLEEIADIGPDLDDALTYKIQQRAQKATIEIVSDGSRTTLTYGDLIFADLIFKRR